MAKAPVAQTISKSSAQHQSKSLVSVHTPQHKTRRHSNRLHAQFQPAHSRAQLATGQHSTALRLAAAVPASARQPAAVAPRQQTGNEHLDGKLKIIGGSLASTLIISDLISLCCLSSRLEGPEPASCLGGKSPLLLGTCTSRTRKGGPGGDMLASGIWLARELGACNVRVPQ